MSSSPPADNPPARRRGPAGWSLRARLLLMLMALLAALCLVIGVTTQIAMRTVLINQLDERLGAAATRPPQVRPHWESELPPPLRFLEARGQRTGTLGAVVADGTVRVAYYLDATGEPQPVPEAQYAALADVAMVGSPYTERFGDFGPYRVVASPLGQPGDLLIVGLPLADTYDALYKLAVVEVIAAGLALAAAAFGGAAVIRVTLRPLRRVAATAGRVAELPLHSGDVALPERVPEIDTDPRTEVGQVGAAVNRMLGHIEAAFAARQASEARLRQFVADASHELRTPLAAIRGYAELGRRSRDQFPPEVSRVLSRVESQATRMTSLVEDLLLLARLDAGRPLQREPVDLSALVIEATGDARVAGPDHRWRLDLPGEPVLAYGDAIRLHQVLGNVLTNARAHTPPGTTVRVGLAVDGDQAVVTITDDGPGIPADLQPNIFQRFARGDTSRSRAAGSTGLGLAIADAVTTAHGGTLEVASRPGQTTFTVRLPRTLP
ncbi:MAG TPA: HAMP domain-containing sensor histidine kinase [Pilimelia sp.]|nr:HAMP domain-containing sensor histidine kinase [Pilimelia sp.]